MRVITLARKPFKGKIVDNLLKHGCGALNIDPCRISTTESTARRVGKSAYQRQKVPGTVLHGREGENELEHEFSGGHSGGRWPANLILQGQDVADALDEQSGYLKTGKVASHSDKGMWSSGADVDYADQDPGGGASRFFKQVGNDGKDDV